MPRIVDESVDRTPTRTTHLCKYSASQHALHRCSHHAYTRGSSAQRRVAFIGALWKIVIHAQCLTCCRTCHQNTSPRSLSSTSLVFRPSSLSLTCPISARSGLEYETLRDPRRSGGYTKTASPSGYEPKLTQSGDFLKELSWTEILGLIYSRRIELDRNIGTDPYQIPERILGDDNQNPVTEDTEETGKF